MLNLVQLVLLAAIWGSSFLFMRIAAVEVQALWIAEGRVFLAALFLAITGFYLGRRLHWRRHWRHFLIIGAFNAAIPFVLFAYAAQSVSASLLSVMNATAPIWGATIAAVTGREPLRLRVALGLGLGVCGVAILVGYGGKLAVEGALLGVLAAASAAFCYGIASNYAASAPAVEPFANAHGSMWASVLVLAPMMPLAADQVLPSWQAAAAVGALGVLCSGIAYILYFRLIHALGATSALSVTFLIPVFGIFWGSVFLGETIGWHTVLGAGVVLTGTMLVTGFSPRWLRRLLPAGR